MDHVLFIQKVKKDKKDKYIEYHKSCAQELLKEINDAGIEREIIWVNGEQLIVYIMARNFDVSMDNLSRKEIFKDWLVLMDPLLSEVQDYSDKGKIIKLQEVFNLEKQII